MARFPMLLVSTLSYIVFVVVAVVGPALAVHRLLRLRIDPAVVLPLGFAVCAFLYWLSLLFGAWLFPVLVLALDLSLLLRRPRLAEGPSLRGVVPPFLAVMFLLALTRFPGNRPGSSGEFLLDPIEAVDTAFHVGLTWELSHSYPPQVPGLSGVPLAYHLGPDLVRAAELRWARVHPYDVISRGELALGALALVLGLRGVTRALGGGRTAVALVPWALLATNFSYLFALMAGPEVKWWLRILSGDFLLSLTLASGSVPALALILAALIALGRFRAGEGAGWGILAVALSLALPFFKVFFAGQYVLGFGLAALTARGTARWVAGLMAATCLLTTLGLAQGPGTSAIEIVAAPLAVVKNTRQGLGLAPLGGGPLLAWSLLWLAGSLGLRLIGLPSSFRALTSRAPIVVALAAMALSGWPLGLLFQIPLGEQGEYNHAIYFTELSGFLFWVFAALTLEAGHAIRRRLWLPLVALLCLPTTVEFVLRDMSAPPRVVPASVMRAMSALVRSGRPGDVVVQRPHPRGYPPPPVVFVGRRVPYTRYIPYLSQFAPEDELTRRLERVRQFFQTRDRDEALRIAESLGAAYVCLYEEDEQPLFDTGSVLEPLYAEPPVRLFRIRKAP